MAAELSPTSVAANLSGLLYLARHQPAAEAELQEAVRVLLACLSGRSLAIESTSRGLTINGVRLPSASPGVREVHEGLLGHAISGLDMDEPLEPADLLLLARTMAAFPGTYFTWEELLESLGPVAGRVRLTRAGTELEVIRYNGDQPDVTVRARRSGKRGQDDTLVVPDHGLILPPLVMDEPVMPASSRMAQVSQAHEERRKLKGLIRAGRAAVDAGDMPALLKVSRDFLDVADGLGNEANARLYRLELKRILSRQHLGQFARMAATGVHKEQAIAVLRRLGPSATEILMDLLVQTGSISERRGYYSALTQMEQGTEIIIQHLTHPAWYVVRNAAELCGEMGLVEAVPRLAQQASHPDERVRKSVAVALSKIGSADALEPLARLLKDPSPTVRLQVLGNLDGAKARSLAMPLAALLETEDHPDALREVLRALGRIGTPDAVLALRQVAQGERRFTKRLRLQAIESLGAAGAAGTQSLRALAGNDDPEIGSAAHRVLQGATA